MKSGKPLLSVVLSVFNTEKYLRSSLDSILNQTFKDFKFIIINDGSTDKTPLILRKYKDPRIKIITNKINMGLTKSFNIGLDKAKGEFIAQMDTDDISFPKRFDIQQIKNDT